MRRRGEHLHARQGQLVMGMVGGGAHDGAVPLAQIGLRRAPNLERPPLSRFQIWNGRTLIFCEIDDLTSSTSDTRARRGCASCARRTKGRGAGDAADVEPLRRALAQYDAERRQVEERHSYW